jgi:hypothetical protein
LRFSLSALAVGGALQLALAIAQFKTKSAIQGLFYFLGERALSSATPGIAKASLFGEQILRPYGTFSHPNSLGGFYALLFAWGLWIKPKSPALRHLRLALLTLCLLLILISFSKGAIITTLIVFVAHFFAKRKKASSKKHCTACLIGRGFIAVSVAGLFLLAQGDTFALDKRLMLMQQALGTLARSPILGTGLGHHLYAHAQYTTSYAYFFLQPVHNIFLLFFMQTGVLLGGFSAWKVGAWIKKNVRRKQVLFILLVIALTGMIDHYWLTLQQNMLLMGTILGFATSVRKPAAKV